MKMTATREALDRLSQFSGEPRHYAIPALAEVESAERALSGWRWPPSGYRLWVNEERTVLTRIWENGLAEVATRETEAHTWGAPIHLYEENTI